MYDHVWVKVHFAPVWTQFSYFHAQYLSVLNIYCFKALDIYFMIVLNIYDSIEKDISNTSFLERHFSESFGKKRAPKWNNKMNKRNGGRETNSKPICLINYNSTNQYL